MKPIKSYTVRGPCGNDLIVSETVERDQIVLAIRQNDEGGRIATMRLDRTSLDQLDHVLDAMELQKGDPD